MARRRLRSIQGTIKGTSLKRFDRLRSSNKINLNRQELTDLLETDEFVDLDVSDEEKEELANTGWQYVASSNVKAVKLDTTKPEKPKLQVMFGDGSIYEWLVRAESLYNALLSSASKGRAIRMLGLYGTHARKL